MGGGTIVLRSLKTKGNKKNIKLGPKKLFLKNHIS